MNHTDTDHRAVRPRIGVILAACLLTLAVAASPPALAQSLQTRIDTIVRAGELGTASFGLVVADARTGEELAAMNPDMPLIPASNMKLVTTAAALDTLGDDFVFSTQLRLDDRTLIIHGSGDPGFGDPVLLETLGLNVEDLLNQWVDAVKRAGIDGVDAILIDDRVFDDELIHSAWPVNQLHKWYCAQVGGINFNDNCLDIYAAPTAPGDQPSITIAPEHAAVTLENVAVSGSTNGFWASRMTGTNTIHLRGTVKHALVHPIHVTLHDPPMFLGQTLARQLEAAGIEVKETRRVEPERDLPDGRLLAAVETTLPTILVRCNRDSQNLFAEALFKYLGHHLTGQPGGWSNGAAAVRGFLAGALGAEAASVILDDGSGMSRNNRLSARVLSELLVHMQHQEEIAGLYRFSLAAPGEPGTLSKRFRNHQIEGQIRAKSGYLNGVVSLSGYLTLEDRTIAFSMLLNGYRNGVHRAKQMMEEIVAAVDQQMAAEQPVKLGG